MSPISAALRKRLKAPEVQVLRIRPGDVLVCSIEDRITVEVAQRIKDQLRTAFNNPDLPIVIAANGIRFSVHRPVDAPQPAEVGSQGDAGGEVGNYTDVIPQGRQNGETE
jgi:hypothetical protein